MCDNKYENALVALQKTPSARSLLEILVIIRKNVEWPRNKDNIARLREKGCLKEIVGNLQLSTKNIVDVSLSILGNCMMDKKCARDVVVQFSILSVIKQLLKKYSKEDSINGRVFRIIGNLCQHKDQWANIIVDRKPQIVIQIVDFIKTASKDELPEDFKISYATIVVALKALREMLNSTTIINLVTNFGVLKGVGALFIKYSRTWEVNKENEKLILDIVRLLLEYSRYKYYHSIVEMRNTEKGDALVHLSNVLILAPKKIVRIVMNFIRISQLKSELPIPEICDRFIEVLNSNNIVKDFDSEFVEYLQCLCYLLEHPANRSTDRCGKCIPLLIQLLKDLKEPTNITLECCILIISTLNKCKYDDSLILLQLRSGIISVITEKLYWLVGSSKTLNTRHKDERKRKYNERAVKNFIDASSCSKRLELKYDSMWQPKSPVSSDDELDLLNYTKYTRSPSPCSSTDSDINALSWSSPCSSPMSLKDDAGDSDSDDYSPVCSDVEDNGLPMEDEDFEKLSVENEHVPTSQETEELSNSEDKSISVTLQVRLLTEIARLIKTYIKIRPAVPQLACETLLLALLKCSGKFDWTPSNNNVDTVDVTCQILDSQAYLIPLLQTDLVSTIYSLTETHLELRHSQWCSKCSQFWNIGHKLLTVMSNQAESGAGKGDIAHILLRGSDRVKETVVVNMTYIVRNKSILGKLMINCGGLDTLLNLLREDSSMKQRIIHVICTMAKRRLDITNPLDLNSGRGLNRPTVVADKYKLSETCENVVMFKLDDGSTLKADRDFLISKSDFFNGLLNGYFKESREQEITLPNIETKTLRCLLYLCHTLDRNETVAIDLDLDTLLDVIVLADKYLMEDLCLSLTSSVEAFRISPKTVPIIYKWSIKSGTNLLRVECIAFALVGLMTQEERLAMFESLFDLGYKEELLCDIQKMLTRYLSKWTK